MHKAKVFFTNSDMINPDVILSDDKMGASRIKNDCMRCSGQFIAECDMRWRKGDKFPRWEVSLRKQGQITGRITRHGVKVTKFEQQSWAASTKITFASFAANLIHGNPFFVRQRIAISAYITREEPLVDMIAMSPGRLRADKMCLWNVSPKCVTLKRTESFETSQRENSLM